MITRGELPRDFGRPLAVPPLAHRSGAAWSPEQPTGQRGLDVPVVEHPGHVIVLDLGVARSEETTDFHRALERFRTAGLGETGQRSVFGAFPLMGSISPKQLESFRQTWNALDDIVLTELQKYYVFEDRLAVAAFIVENHLLGPLLEARRSLDFNFAEDALKRLALEVDDEGFETLFCLISIPGDLRLAKEALRNFDENWWLALSGRVGGKLNFDIELI